MVLNVVTNGSLIIQVSLKYGFISEIANFSLTRNSGGGNMWTRFMIEPDDMPGFVDWLITNKLIYDHPGQERVPLSNDVWIYIHDPQLAMYAKLKWG